MNARQQQLAQGRFAGQGRAGEKLERAFGQGFRLGQAPLRMEHQGLVEIDDGDPCLVVLAREKLAGLAKELDGQAAVAVVAAGDGQVGQGLGRFVPHTELPEGRQGAARQMGALFAEVQLQVHFGLVEIAQAFAIGVAELVAMFAGGLVHGDGARVFAAQVEEVGDVVIRAGRQ